ncbi:hypothetical protein [Streptomyces sp. NPDC057854]|uniref:hypothetical protein n=1 Tax=unclassified Streptomyces TaxID=2593676 RepID=UPI0036C9D9DE
MDETTYTSGPRLPLITLDEARRAVALLLHFQDETEEGRAAGDLAHDLALRLPAADDDVPDGHVDAPGAPWRV